VSLRELSDCYWIETNTWRPLLTAAMILSGYLVPSEGARVRVGLGEESFDGGLKFDERLEGTTLELLPVSLAKKPLTALSQEAEGAVKWNVQRF
jgi:hypothetical protein